MTDEEDDAMSDAFSIDIVDPWAEAKTQFEEGAVVESIELTAGMAGIVELLALFTPAQRLLILSQFDFVTGEKKE